MHIHNIFLIESDEFGWSTVSSALVAMTDAYVTGSTLSREVAVTETLKAPPHAIITAREVEDESIIPVLRHLRPQLPDTTFVVIADDYDQNELLALSSIGISGYLLWRNLRGRRLQTYLRAAIGGEAVVITNEVAVAYVMAERKESRPYNVPCLTEREREVLYLLAEGLKHAAIAGQLGVSLRTVEENVANLKRKLGATTEFTICLHAMRLGIIH